MLAPVLSVRQVFRQFWPFTRGLRGLLAVGVVLAVVSVPLEAGSIWLFKVLVDDVLTPRDFTAFPPVAAGYLGLAVLTAGFGFATGQAMTRASEGFLLTVRTTVLAHLQTLSPGFFDRRKLGDLLSRLGADVTAIETLVSSGPATMVPAALQVFVFGGMLFVVDPLLAACSLVVTPLFWVVGTYCSRRLKAVSRESRHRVGELSAIAEKALSNVSLVQAYNGERDVVRRFHAEGVAVVRTSLASSRLRGVFGPLVELVELVGLLVVVDVSTWQLSRGAVTLGGLLVFMAYFAQMYGPLREVGRLGATAYAASAGAERIAEVLRERPDVREDPRPWPVGRAQGLVVMDRVSFTYPGAGSPALQDVSFTARPGDLVAVVGPSGSGKSTLTKLLLRFYDPTSGTVTLDGHDVRDRTLADLRTQIGLVMQEALMMAGSLRDNIVWGRPDADRAAFEAAVRAADVDSVAADLPAGFETEVGHRGRRLCGGQRQRVAIARAMIRDAPVLLLDEPAAGLDPAAQRRVLGPLNQLRAGRTTILVSHDVAGTRDADLVLVLDGGRVVQSGLFEELAAADGLFRRLLADQLE